MFGRDSHKVACLHWHWTASIRLLMPLARHWSWGWRFGDIRESQNWLSGEFGLQVAEGSFLVRSPSPGVWLFGEIQEEAGDVGQGRDELPVEDAESKKGLDGLDVGWWRPFSNGLEFDRIHLYSSFFYYHAEVFHFSAENMHFSSLRYIFCSQNCCRTFWVRLLCNSWFEEWISRSSM